MEEQLSLFDIEPQQMDSVCCGSLHIVKAMFESVECLGYQKLFEGFDELYGITFSSGIPFMEKVFENFEHVDMIFGCEGVLSDDLATIISAQVCTVEELVKCKSARRIAERMREGSVDISVSRDTRSHEKIFILKAKDGRTRVITGSANMSASAFLGIQRENIICFDDADAYSYYKDLFDEFKDKCSDTVSEKLLIGQLESEEHIQDNIEETPILKTLEKKHLVILEPTSENEEAEIVADIKGLEAEIKPLLPKVKERDGKVMLTGEVTRGFKRKFTEHAHVKKEKQKKLPKLHIDYETHSISFNQKEMNLTPDADAIRKDLSCLFGIINSLDTFYGDYKKSQRDYYRFFNWYFASPFMPYLRYIGDKTNYGVIYFPVMGILYGESNGGKSTFIALLSKLMSGAKIRKSSSNDFTATNISYLKTACEGVPINIDDLAKTQYDSHFEKVIKEDDWGLLEHRLNYPSVVITSNKLNSLKPDIAKRVVTCRIDIRIDKETGAYNAKRINESMKHATNALFAEYARRMFARIEDMENAMREGDETYHPDIFRESSEVLCEIMEEYGVEKPEYVARLAYKDYFGDLAVGQHAIDQIRIAWESDPKLFRADRKKNTLTYTYPDGGRTYELKYLKEELPPILECNVTARSLVMKLDAAREVFGISFRRGIIG